MNPAVVALVVCLLLGFVAAMQIRRQRTERAQRIARRLNWGQ